MSKLKHSPGPWKIGTAINQGALAIFDVNADLSGKTVDAVCLISPLCKITETDEANAAMISAAPEMYDALYELAQWSKQPAGYKMDALQRDRQQNELIAIVSKGIAAITKAKTEIMPAVEFARTMRVKSDETEGYFQLGESLTDAQSAILGSRIIGTIHRAEQTPGVGKTNMVIKLHPDIDVRQIDFSKFTGMASGAVIYKVTSY